MASRSSDTRGPDAARGARLPARYATGWYEQFEARVRPSLELGTRVLDVGSGRTPALAPERRPDGCFYAGLELSAEELGRAPRGSYDETIAADASVPLPQLCGRFDLLLSWQVLEHVAPLDVALTNLRSYLRPGGRMVALLSGGLSAFGLINRAISPRLGVWALERLIGRDPDTVFPACYDCCTYTALVGMLRDWSDAEVVPLFRRSGRLCGSLGRAGPPGASDLLETSRGGRVERDPWIAPRNHGLKRQR
jgi:SAM-dependent methyltransferase